MEFKAVALVLLIAALEASAGRVKFTGEKGLFTTEYGPDVLKAVNGKIAALPDPFEVFRPDQPLKVDLAELAKGQQVKVTGYAEIFSVVIHGIQNVALDDAVATFIGPLSDFPFDVKGSAKNVDIVVKYKVDAQVEGKVPVYGEGDIKAALKDATVEVKGNVTNLMTTFKLPYLDYDLDIPDFTVDVQGILNDDDLSGTVSQLMTDLVNKKVLQPLTDHEGYTHKILVATAKAGFNAMKLTKFKIMAMRK